MIQAAKYSCQVVAKDADPVTASYRLYEKSRVLRVTVEQWMAALRFGVPTYCPELEAEFDAFVQRE